MKRPKHLKKCNNFPNVTKNNHLITSNEDVSYNCIAFAAGHIDRKMWPTFHPDYVWPPCVPTALTVSSFVALYESYGYHRCENGDYESSKEKICLWAIKDGTPTHAALQIGANKWSSKLGDSFDIEHKQDAIAGGLYGLVEIYMERAKNR